MAAARIIDRDLGYQQRMKALLEARRGAEMTVGLHAEDADGAMVEVAERNEFGSPGGMIPARPSIGAWADERADQVSGEIAEHMRAALTAGRNPLQRLDQLAQSYAGEIQADIAAGIEPDNAPSTIARKGSSTPLIDTGVFRSSIAGRVRAR